MTRFVVTDISNVARYLSLGCLGPRTIHDEKYRPDASVSHGGALVLFDEVRLAAQEAARSQGAVVILEIEGDYLDSIPVQDGLALTGSLIPASSILRLHFRDEATQREFRTLEYQNIDPMMLEQVVNRDVFDVADIGVGDADSATGMRTPQATLPIEEVDAIHRLDLVSVEQVEDIDRSVGALAAILRPLRPSKVLFRKAADIASAVIESTQGPDAVAGDALVSKRDRPIHAAICAAIRRTPHEDVGHDEIVDALAGQMPDLANQFTVIREMMAAARDVALDEFSSSCLRALLLALMRRSPAALRSFSFDKLPDDLDMELLALWYAGLREGGARRPVADRLGGFEARLYTWAARQGAAGAPPALPKVAFKPKVRATVGDGRFEYFLEEKFLSVGPIIREFPSLRERLKAVAGTEKRKALGIAKALNVPIVTLITFRENIVFDMSDSGLRVCVPHDIDQDTNLDAVRAAVDGASDDYVQMLADRYATPPEEAP